MKPVWLLHEAHVAVKYARKCILPVVLKVI